MLSDAVRGRLWEHFPVFEGLPGALAARVVAESQYRRAEPGKVVFEHGAPCAGLPLILDGSLRVVQRGANGREVELYRVDSGEGCVLSAACLLGAIEYTATAIAASSVALVVIPPGLFSALIDQSPGFRGYVFAELGARISLLMAVVEAVVFRRLDERLAVRLLARGGTRIEVTHQALADELGSVREIVTRILRSFEDRGWVSLGRGHIIIRDRKGLLSLVNQGDEGEDS